MSKFEVFNDEQQLFRRIDQLRMDDIKDEDITVVADEKLDSHSIIYYTSVYFIKSHVTLWDRFAAKFADNDVSGRVRDQPNLSRAAQAEHDDALGEGGILLLVYLLTRS